VSDDQEVEIPDKTAMKLLEGLSCLSNASDLLLDGFNPCHPEIRRWLAGANDDLAAAGLEDRPGDIRHELTTAIEIIELHDPSTTDLVTPARIDLLHRRVAIIFRSYFRFSRSI
jgi:hypothetical protein